MPDEHKPTYRYRGSVQPSAEVSRPVQATRTASNGSGAGGSSATLDIFDVIDSIGGWWGISAGDVDLALKQLGDVDTLYVRLNSPGGEATEGIAIANLLRAHKADVRVTVYGLAASAASLIAIAGDTVSMAPGSLMMIHEASVFAFGDSDTMRRATEMLDAMNDSGAALYAMKAGGDTADWRAVMKDVKWYTAEAAVTAKLADQVGLDPQLPAGLPPVEDDTDDPDFEIEIDVAISPAARAAARRFDLSMLPNTPAALAAPQAPAASADGSTETQEGSATVDFTDEQLTTMRQALGLPEDADAAAIVAAQAEALAEKADPPTVKPDEADAAAVAAALAKDGKVAVSQAYLDTLKEGSDAGKAALARQQREDRDKAIAAAQAEGKIGRAEATVKAWQSAWDRDPEGTAKEIAALGVRFPVGPTEGFAGDDQNGADAAFSDDEAAALGALAGVSKEGLMA